MTSPDYWQVIGFAGQGIFTARFLVQWAASEKKRDSVIPVAFWWLSILGGFNLLAYSIYRRDPVFILGQSMGLFVYGRNLMLVARKKRRELNRLAHAVGIPGPHRGQAGHPAEAPKV